MKYGRELLRDVEGYVPGEQPASPEVVKLNTNENPYPPSPRAVAAVQSLTPDAMRRYPDPLALALREECARRYGYAGSDWVIAGNGMDELLALAVRTFTDPGDRILTTDPTYTLYETLCRLHGAELVSVPLDESFQIPGCFHSTDARVCMVARPNAPSGVSAPRRDMERLCESFGGLVVIDEAYVDFADNNCMDFPRRYENAIVMRTFSKSFSLAGLRLGIAVARPEIIAEFLKTKDSYNLNAATQAAGLAAMKDYDYMLANVRRVRTTRARLTEGLVRLGFDVPPSETNFVLARWSGSPPAAAIFEELKQRRVYVRYFRAPGLGNALRITVGTDEETDALLEAVEEIVR